MTLTLGYDPPPPPTPVQSLMRGLFINQAAGTVLTQPMVSGYELVCVQPQQIAGYTKEKNGTASLPGAPTMAELKSWMAAPTGTAIGPKVLCYLNSMRETGYDRSTPPFWTPYAPQPNWYLYDAKGQKIMDGTPNPLMSPVSSWVPYQRQKLSALLADPNMWDGPFWDVLSLFSMRGGPVDPVRGGLYTPANWITDLHGMAIQLASNPTRSWDVGNSLESAAKYWGAGSNGILSQQFPSGMAEQYLRNPNDPVDSFPGSNTTGGYVQHITMIDQVCRTLGGTFYGICKLWIPNPTPAQENQWQRLTAAVALSGMQGYGSVVVTFELSAADTGNYPMLAPVIGIPADLTQAATIGAIITRRFTNGLVALNDGNKDVPLPFPLPASQHGTWTDVGPVIPGTPGGQQWNDGDAPTIPANNALILKDY